MYLGFFSGCRFALSVSFLVASQFDKHAFCYLCATRFCRQTLKMMHAKAATLDTKYSPNDLHNNRQRKTKATHARDCLCTKYMTSIERMKCKMNEPKKKTTTYIRGFRVYWFAKNGMELKIIYGWFLFLCVSRYLSLCVVCMCMRQTSEWFCLVIVALCSNSCM